MPHSQCKLTVCAAYGACTRRQSGKSPDQKKSPAHGCTELSLSRHGRPDWPSVPHTGHLSAGKMILFTKKNTTIDTPPLSTVVPML